VFNLKQNTQHYAAENDVRPAIDFKIIRLAGVLFEFETHDLDGFHNLVCAVLNAENCVPAIIK
jgi:hypothetical protein